MENGTFKNIEYSLEFNVIDEKKPNYLFSNTYNLLKIDEVVEKINYIMIKSYLLLDKAMERKDFSILLA